MPGSVQMQKLTMRNSVLQALYYRTCCKILVDNLFGWDSTANKAKAEPGIFGFVEALFYALEQQGRLRVHMHGVLWVVGLPKTKSDWEKVLSDDVMRARFEEYCASVSAAELPVYDSVVAIQCPGQTCTGELRPIPINVKYNGQGLQAYRYAISYATKCQTTFDNIAVMELAMRRRAEREASAPAHKTVIQQGIGSIMSLAHSASSTIEIGGPPSCSKVGQFASVLNLLHYAMTDRPTPNQLRGHSRELAKQRVARVFREGGDWRFAATHNDLPYTTARRAVLNDAAPPKQRGGVRQSSVKMTVEVMAKLEGYIHHLDEDCRATLSDMCDRLHSDTGVVVGKPSVHRALQSH
ncbi:unnamed protein product [Phytophthora fragariaefolia]|uniref:Unnamed protein product n=1 Tax=Phytophthora fragariaefolia TaxID=1490495 RepID=A0A9W6XW82_9STRA|nr:unnamed protein product [Phytophthora fragariaefolia]